MRTVLPLSIPRDSLDAGATADLSTPLRGTMTVDRQPRLVDVRQIGPKSERDISGRCSVCNTVMIARLDTSEEAKIEKLRERLEKVFARHLAATGCSNRESAASR